MNKICLLGGGRWSRVLLSVLRNLTDDEIIWVTRACLESSRHWLTENSIANVSVQADFIPDKKTMAGVIVATSSKDHFENTRTSISESIPTLCEKPLVLHSQEAKVLLDLSAKLRCPTGVHFEFLYASYLQQFSQILKDRNVKSISIFWKDPWLEERHGQAKQAGVYTDIAHDMGSHCWSLLKALLGDKGACKIDSATYEQDSAIKVAGCYGFVPFDLEISRRAEKRLRKISVNQGQYELDFSKEPGATTVDGHTTENQWHGPSPLTNSLNSFLQVIRDPSMASSWPLSLREVAPSVGFSEDIYVLLEKSRQQLISQMKADGTNTLDNPKWLELIADTYLPQDFLKGSRAPAKSMGDLKKFAKRWFNE